MNSNLKVAAIAVASSLATLGVYHFATTTSTDPLFKEATPKPTARLVDFNGAADAPGNFTYAAEVSTPSVVHIKATAVRTVRQRVPSIFEEFFGGMPDGFSTPRNQQQQSSGSGVIITSDGYIITNNHVVEGADELEVITSDKRSFPAKIVGTDPSTDIAVIKVEKGGLTAVTFGNSDNIRVGEWVLAVGNPFSLESTVTAGIVSAIGRNINILSQRLQEEYSRTGKVTGESPIESFIQTDAAVNPGNSGGALVNLRGELIGINTAIASPNGAYAGYAFAVPSAIAKKVAFDLIKYGNVQRGYIGIAPRELSSTVARELNISQTEGIYVDEAPSDGAAYAAGIRKGDVLIAIDDVKLTTEPRFREMVGRKRPGESVKITYDRNGTRRDVTVTLRNREGGNTTLKAPDAATASFDKLGIELENLSAADKRKMGIQNGVRIKKLSPQGDIARYTDIREGFIITQVGNSRVDSIDEIRSLIATAKRNNEDGVLICGTYEGYSRRYCGGVSL